MDANLVLFNRQGQKKQIPLKEGITVIGRRPDCDVRVPIMRVSRKHCRIVFKGGKATIQDLGSTNGTFVNDDRIMEREITAGDVLTVGAVKFTLQVDGKPKEIAPPETDYMDEHDPDATGYHQSDTQMENEETDESMDDVNPLP